MPHSDMGAPPVGWAQSVFVVCFSILCWALPHAVNQRQDFPMYCCTIDKPYISDETVPYARCLVLCFGVAFTILGASSYCSGRGSDQRQPSANITAEITAFLHGLFLASSIAEGLCAALIKRYVGRPRPHFFSRCGWDGNECTNAVETSAYQSFPSGHSTVAFASLSFTALFCLGKLQLSEPRTLRLYENTHVDVLDVLIVVVLSPLGLAAWIASSRVVDHMHHASDVVAGAALGSFWGTIFYKRYFANGPTTSHEHVTTTERELPRTMIHGVDMKDSLRSHLIANEPGDYFPDLPLQRSTNTDASESVARSSSNGEMI